MVRLNSVTIECVHFRVKTIVHPILFCSTGGRGNRDAQSNRDYVVLKQSNEIHEIIRVLQLTTYDEDEWGADDITVMKKALNALEGKMKQVHVLRIHAAIYVHP